MMPRPKKSKPNRSDGRYEVKITIGKNLKGEPERKSFYSTVSKEDAERQAEEYKINTAVAHATGSEFVDKNINFSNWAYKWLEAKKGTVKQYTYDVTYKNKIDKYIVPYFGRADLKNIKQVDIQTFFNKHSYLSKSMQDKFKIILHSIFESAIDNDLCYKNPVKNIKITDGVKIDKKTYTKSEVAKVVKKCIELRYTDILLLIKTGIRRSELLGLKWSDIDIKQKYIRIERAVTPSAGNPVVGLPKSDKSIRDIPIDDELTEYLKNNTDSGYVTTGAEIFMTPSGYDKHYKTKMTPLTEELEIKYLSPHELRHTYGTLLRERGADIYTIQKVMGHSDINVTAKIYVHNDIDVLRKNMKL